MRRLSAVLLLLLLLSVVLLLLLMVLLLLEVGDDSLRVRRLRHGRVVLLLLLLTAGLTVSVRPIAKLIVVQRWGTVDSSTGELVEVDLRDSSSQLQAPRLDAEGKEEKRTFNPLPLNSNPLNIFTALSAS